MSVISQAGQRLTPDEVQAMSFRPTRIGRRGLEEEPVRAFCGQVEAELELLLSERTSLQQEVNRLRQRVLGTSVDAGPAASRPAAATAQAVGILSRAQQTAEQYVAQAQAYGAHLAREARRRRDEILAQARSRADQALEDAHDEASRAARRALTGAPGQRAAAAPAAPEAEAAYLRTFSQVYRERLRTCLDDLLRDAAEQSGAAGPVG
jgi:cell division septum initiation protein DivIVA